MAKKRGFLRCVLFGEGTPPGTREQRIADARACYDRLREKNRPENWVTFAAKYPEGHPYHYATVGYTGLTTRFGESIE